MVAVRIPRRHRHDNLTCLSGTMRTGLGTATAALVGLAALLSPRALRQRLTGLLRHEARRLLLPLAALTAVSSAGTLAAPGLLHHDQSLLLVALSPRLSFLAIAAPQTHLVPFLVVAGIRLCLADPFHFRLGQRHGAGAVHRLTGARNRLVRRAATAATRCIPLLVFLRPNGTNLAIAGASGDTRAGARRVIVADAVGTLVYLVLIHRLGAHVVPG